MIMAGPPCKAWSIGGRSTALLLAVRGGDTLVTLDDSLNQLASVAAGQAKSVQQYRNGGLSADSVRRGKLWL